MMKNYPEFKNVSVIVTGVASGIGRAQAEKFLLEGAFVFGGDINDNEVAIYNVVNEFCSLHKEFTDNIPEEELKGYSHSR